MGYQVEMVLGVHGCGKDEREYFFILMELKIIVNGNNIWHELYSAAISNSDTENE